MTVEIDRRLYLVRRRYSFEGSRLIAEISAESVQWKPGELTSVLAFSEVPVKITPCGNAIEVEVEDVYFAIRVDHFDAIADRGIPLPVWLGRSIDVFFRRRLVGDPPPEVGSPTPSVRH